MNTKITDTQLTWLFMVLFSKLVVFSLQLLWWIVWGTIPSSFRVSCQEVTCGEPLQCPSQEVLWLLGGGLEACTRLHPCNLPLQCRPVLQSHEPSMPAPPHCYLGATVGMK